MSRINDCSPDDLESIVEAFELELDRDGAANLTDYLPVEGSASYLDVAVELIRVDLECARARGSKRRLEEYRRIVPAVFEDPRALAQVAFEEYRLRQQEGETVDAAEYSHRFSLDVSKWPAWQRADAGKLRSHSFFGVADASNGGRPGALFAELGARFAGFELMELLGRGAFGVVYRARQQDLAHRDVVLKITPARTVEPQRLARLQHTNIVPIYSVHQEAATLGICMPFLGRHTLEDLLRGRKEIDPQARLSTVGGKNLETINGLAPESTVSPNVEETPASEVGRDLAPLGIAAAIDVVAQLAEGLAHAHARGIVHSDLKPANVLLADDGTPLLVDFNLAADSARGDIETLVVGGTLSYMSPEHLRATRDASPANVASDIYSLGVIFFELLARQRPFPHRGGTFDECVEAMIADRQRGAPDVKSLNAAVSPAVASMVAKCLAPSAVDRYRQILDLAEDLRRQQANLPLRFAAEPSLAERSRKWLRRNARGVRVAAIVGLVGLLLAALAMWSARHEELLKLEANSAFAEFEHDFVSASLSLHTPGSEPDLYADGREAAQRALARFEFIDGRGENGPLWRRLSSEQQQKVNEQAIKLQYALAGSPNQRQLLFAEHDASSSLGTYLHGIVLLEKRESAAAMKVFEGLRERDPQDATTWLLLGNASYRAHRLPDAEASYTAVIALVPRGYTGYFYRGECRMDQQRFAEAATDFDEVLRLKPGLPAGLMNRALVWNALGNLERAERDATAAIEGGLNNPRAFFVRALIRDARGNTEGARADREQGFSLQPIDAQGWSARGNARLSVDPRLAREDFAAGLQAFPDTPDLLHNLIHVDGDVLGHQQAALASADRLVEICPDEPSAWSTRAVLRARLGDGDGARQDAKHAAAQKTVPLTALQLACAYARLVPAQLEAAELAVQQLRDALARDPRLAVRAATDPDLESIRGRDDYTKLVAAAKDLVDGQQSVSIATPTNSLDHHD